MDLSPRFETVVRPDIEDILPASSNSFGEAPVTTGPSSPLSSSEILEKLLLNAEISRVISASQSTTLFTAITPRQSIQAVTSTAEAFEATATAAEDNVPSATQRFNRFTDIGIAFGIFVALTVIVVGIVFCVRHKKSKKPPKSQGQHEPKTIDYRDWRQANLSAPSVAHIPKDSNSHPGAMVDNYAREHNQWAQPPLYQPSQTQNANSIPNPPRQRYS
ncbi:hypothetical protein AK830_g3788 [Neonectria ditissima]|uniref:Uncharacterized protein n=1 Tax=Neonectria ditissima TaxID=78410 RepID=A0A0P7BHD0_9HYPO|nr:hypothetical protein AK830_g3788 [Neonectria ditissima]